MGIREILKFDHELLHKQAKVVKKFDNTVKEIINDMIDTLKENNGAGLAANQIGILKRIIVFQVKQDDKEEVIPLINPKITKYIGNEIATEGCLSFPEMVAEIKRATKIFVKAQNEKGKNVRFVAVGLPARIIQHEIDHLNGILIIDRAEEGTFRKIERLEKKEEISAVKNETKTTE